MCGIYYALADTRIQSDWADNIPLGSSWSPPPDVSSRPSEKLAAKNSKAKSVSTMHPQGDRVLASSITFMRDALMSREMSYAVAEGDMGRVYEILKVMFSSLFCTSFLTFSRSFFSHFQDRAMGNTQHICWSLSAGLSLTRSRVESFEKQC